jgi:transposase InsO family protein
LDQARRAFAVTGSLRRLQWRFASGISTLVPCRWIPPNHAALALATPAIETVPSDSKLLKQFHMTQSMSRKGNCWDNAPIESFFKTLKVERIYRLQYPSRDQARLDIVNWIEGFYNEKRLHSAIDYRSPADFERSLNAA